MLRRGRVHRVAVLVYGLHVERGYSVERRVVVELYATLFEPCLHRIRVQLLGLGGGLALVRLVPEDAVGLGYTRLAVDERDAGAAIAV